MDIGEALGRSAVARVQERAVGGKSALAFLQEARAKIADRSKWIQGAAAVTAAGVKVQAHEADAHRYSLQGAMDAVQVYGSLEWQKAVRLLREITGPQVQRWNDRWWRTHRGVLKALERAMERA